MLRTTTPVDLQKNKINMTRLSKMKLPLTEYKELTCVKLTTNEIKYTSLVDGGSNCSVITKGLVEGLGLTSRLVEKRIIAKSWNNEKTQFIGRIKLQFEIGGQVFKQRMLVAESLATGTSCILGLDWLVKSKTLIQYSPEKVTMSIDNGRIELPLVRLPLSGTLPMY